MAKQPSKKQETKITRIKASDKSSNTDKHKETKTVEVKKRKKLFIKKMPKFRLIKKDKGIIGYFRGSWEEIKQVRWPDRKATWKMTGALLVFTLFFFLVIVALDYGFDQFFKLIMGSTK